MVQACICSEPQGSIFATANASLWAGALLAGPAIPIQRFTNGFESIASEAIAPPANQPIDGCNPRKQHDSLFKLSVSRKISTGLPCCPYSLDCIDCIVASDFSKRFSRSLVPVNSIFPACRKGAGRIEDNPSGLYFGEHEEWLAITIRFFQALKRPIKFTQQTIHYRHLCRSPLTASRQLLQFSQRGPRRFRLSRHSESLR